MNCRYKIIVVLAAVAAASMCATLARAQSSQAKPLTFPIYRSEPFCERHSRRSKDIAADCLAAELSFRWSLSRAWPHLAGHETDQAEICVNSVKFLLPDTGSYRALAECVAGLSNIHEWQPHQD